MTELSPEDLRKQLKAVASIRRTIAIITRPDAKTKPATWRKYKQVILCLERDLRASDGVVSAFAKVLNTAIQGSSRIGRKMAYDRCVDALDMAEAEIRGERYEMPATAEEEVNHSARAAESERSETTDHDAREAGADTPEGQEAPGLAKPADQETQDSG
jgi:hypothetical protein